MAQTFEAAVSTEIDGPPDAVWRALTEPELIARYMYGAVVETDWAEGSPIFWRGEWKDAPYEDKGTVLAVQPLQRLAYTHWSPLTGEPDEPANYHHVGYDLEPLDGGRTRLTITHGNSPTQEAADAMVDTGWRPTLDAIKQLVEDPPA